MISTNYVLPKPRNEQLFEELVCDIFAHEFKNPNLQLYGRKGQQQDGIDVIGERYFVGQDFSKGKLTAIQCKNHTVPLTDKQLQEEIDKELAKLEQSTLPIEQYLFVTSADNTKPVIDYVTKLRDQRVSKGKCPIFILFWDFVAEKVGDNPTLLYKYFTRLMPSGQADNLTLPDLHQATRQTLTISVEELLAPDAHNTLLPRIKEIAQQNLGGVEPQEPYNLYVGLSAHKNVHFRAKVDLDVNFATPFADVKNLEEKYEMLLAAINSLVILFTDPFFATNIVLYTDIEVNFALLLGRAFRIHKRQMFVVFREQVWTTDPSLVPVVLPEIIEERPQFNTVQERGNEAAFIFNATTRTHIVDDVQDSLATWQMQPNIVTSYRLKDNAIASSAHALSVAQSIAQRLHNLETWKVRTIHTFLVMPKPLALLTGYHLNTLNADLRLYFLNPERDNYLETGTLTNRTFR